MYLSGMSMNATGKLLGVSAQSVLNWVRNFGEVNYEKSVPESAVVVELDELWHFVQAKKQIMGLEGIQPLPQLLGTITTFGKPVFQAL